MAGLGPAIRSEQQKDLPGDSRHTTVGSSSVLGTCRRRVYPPCCWMDEVVGQVQVVPTRRIKVRRQISAVDRLSCREASLRKRAGGDDM